MALYDIFANSLVKFAYFLDDWLNYIVGAAVIFYVAKYFFVKDWNKTLFEAARNGNAEKLDLSLSKGADVNALQVKESTALIEACIKNHMNIVLKLLATDKCKIDIQDEEGKTALFCCAKYGHLELVRVLLNKKADMKIPSNDGTSPLVAAVCEGHEDVVELLLGKGADVKFKNKYGLNALNAAINCHSQEGGRMSIIQRILTSGPTTYIESKTGAGWTALMKASFKGYLEIVELLLSYNADVDAKAENGFTSLIAASQNGWFEVVKVLLLNGADVTAELYDGSTALIAACYGGYTEIVELLIEHDEVKRRLKQVKHASRSNSHDSSDEKDTRVIALNKIRPENISIMMLNVGIVSHRYKMGSTALMAATYRGFVDVAKVLVAHNIDVNLVNNEGWSALTVACEKGCYKIAKLLLESGANPNVVNNAGFVPLMYACKMGFVDIAAELIKHGAHVNHISFHSNELKTSGLSNGDNSKGNDENLKSIGNVTKTMAIIDGYIPPLMLAIASHNIAMISLLIENGADVNLNMSVVSLRHMDKRDFSQFGSRRTKSSPGPRDESGMPPTGLKRKDGGGATAAGGSPKANGGGTPHAAAGQPRVYTPRNFKKGGAKMTTKDIKALEEEESRNLEMILGELEEMNSIYEYFSTPLMFAVFVEDVKIVEVLLRHGAEVNALNGDNDTTLTIAGLIGNYPMLRVLLDYGATAAPGDRGKTRRNVLWCLAKNMQFLYMTKFISTSLHSRLFPSKISLNGGTSKFKED